MLLKDHVLPVTRKGEAKAVLMDVETYDSWRKALAMLKIVAMAEADFAAGRTMSQEEAFRRAEEALAKVEHLLD